MDYQAAIPYTYTFVFLALRMLRKSLCCCNKLPKNSIKCLLNTRYSCVYTTIYVVFYYNYGRKTERAVKQRCSPHLFLLFLAKPFSLGYGKAQSCHCSLSPHWFTHHRSGAVLPPASFPQLLAAAVLCLHTSGLFLNPAPQGAKIQLLGARGRPALCDHPPVPVCVPRLHQAAPRDTSVLLMKLAAGLGVKGLR